MRKVLLSLLGLFFVFPAFGQRLRMLMESKWWEKPQVIEKLQLTPEQQKTINTIFVEHMNRIIDLKAEVEKRELALNELLDTENPQEKDLLKAVNGLIQARMSLEKERATMHVRIRTQLTKAQWDMVKQGFRQHLKKQLRRKLKQRMMLEHHNPRLRPEGEAPPPPPEP